MYRPGEEGPAEGHTQIVRSAPAALAAPAHTEHLDHQKVLLVRVLRRSRHGRIRCPDSLVQEPMLCLGMFLFLLEEEGEGLLNALVLTEGGNLLWYLRRLGNQILPDDLEN